MKLKTDLYKVLLTAVQDSGEYSFLMRILGLYPIAAVPVAIITHRVHI